MAHDCCVSAYVDTHHLIEKLLLITIIILIASQNNLLSTIIMFISCHSFSAACSHTAFAGASVLSMFLYSCIQFDGCVGYDYCEFVGLPVYLNTFAMNQRSFFLSSSTIPKFEMFPNGTAAPF